MSIELYQTRLFWDGLRGAAKDRGRTVTLTVAPVLPGFPDLVIERIDWAPFVVAEIQPLREAKRDLKSRELAAIRLLLEEMTK